MSFRFSSLASGSSGNATLVECCKSGSSVRLLVDCGLPAKALEARLQARGVAPSQIDAIFITHEHSDHVGCVLPLALTHRIPVWMSRGTYHAIGEPDFSGLLHLAHDAQAIPIRDLCLHPFTVAHDAKEPLQLTLNDGDKRLGIVTDLGHISTHTAKQLQGLDALLLEFNHDEAMLAGGRYPPFLKARVGGAYGHLNNAQSATLLAQVSSPRLQTVVAAHLSAQNNQPKRVQEAFDRIFEAGQVQGHLHIAHPQDGTPWLAV